MPRKINAIAFALTSAATIIFGVLLSEKIQAAYLCFQINYSGGSVFSTCGAVRDYKSAIFPEPSDVRIINLEACGWTDSDVATLRLFEGTRYLRLASNPIKGHGLRYLSDFDSLVEMTLSDTQVDDSTIDLFRNSSALEDIALARTCITDSSVATLSELPRLSRLDISGTAITDQSLRKLATSHSLSELRISNTAATDMGLLALVDVSSLKLVVAHSTAITPTAVEAFLRKRPDVSIDRR